MKTKFLISFFFLGILFLFGCGSDSKKVEDLRLDIQEVKYIAEETACRQCEAMECDACQSTPICRGKCGGCDEQCGIASPPPSPAPQPNATPDPAPGLPANTSNTSIE